MNLDLDADQALIVDAVHEGLSRTAGPVRTRELGFGLDLACAAELAAGGYLDVAMGGGAGDFLAAVLVIEKGAELLAGVPIGARTLVAPYVGVQDPPTTVALASGDGSVVRYGAEAEAVLMLDGDCVRWLRAGEFAAEPVPSRMAYPLATVTARPGTGQVIGVADAAARMTRSWRVLLAAEIGAAMSAAIDVSRAYVSARTQFGRHIGSLQAVQHRLAQALVQARGATWLARHAAWNIDSDLQAALAAAYATAAAHDVFDAVHQVVGAIGFTTEFDLHLWSMRLPVLAAELGGPAAHAADACRLTFPADA